MKLKYYKVMVKIPGAGRYVPDDGWGDYSQGYREDKYMDFIILGASARRVKEIVKEAYPDAKIPQCELLGDM